MAWLSVYKIPRSSFNFKAVHERDTNSCRRLWHSHEVFSSEQIVFDKVTANF